MRIYSTIIYSIACVFSFTNMIFALNEVNKSAFHGWLSSLCASILLILYSLRKP